MATEEEQTATTVEPTTEIRPQGQFIALDEVVAQKTPRPPVKNLDAYVPGQTVEPRDQQWAPLAVSPAKPPSKVSTFAIWARNFPTGRSWVVDLNVIPTNCCTQTCPMCNSYVLAQTNRADMKVEVFRRYLEKLAPYRIASCTISGGEPTIVPDMPEILVEAQRSFPFGVTLISNFYGSTKRIMRVMETALRLNINISCSFDGFGEVADKQRGARNVAEHVLSDLNLHQYPQILGLVKELGIRHTVATVNNFNYLAANLEDPGDFPALTPGPALEEAVEMAIRSGHLTQSHEFVRGIPAYARHESPKVCPYLIPGLKRMKLFIEPSGDISLCDRQAIGNINHQTLEEVFAGEAYKVQLRASIEPCPGCWLTCFVELPLHFRPKSLLKLDFLHRRTPKHLR